MTLPDAVDIGKRPGRRTADLRGELAPQVVRAHSQQIDEPSRIRHRHLYPLFPRCRRIHRPGMNDSSKGGRIPGVVEQVMRWHLATLRTVEHVVGDELRDEKMFSLLLLTSLCYDLSEVRLIVPLPPLVLDRSGGSVFDGGDHALRPQGKRQRLGELHVRVPRDGDQVDAAATGCGVHARPETGQREEAEEGEGDPGGERPLGTSTISDMQNIRRHSRAPQVLLQVRKVTRPSSSGALRPKLPELVAKEGGATVLEGTAVLCGGRAAREGWILRHEARRGVVRSFVLRHPIHDVEMLALVRDSGDVETAGALARSALDRDGLHHVLLPARDLARALGHPAHRHHLLQRDGHDDPAHHDTSEAEAP
mmetsp:Transcript_153742/g.492935  ORF Transcript_153742/g.492935 Transcript_153742/m.492935 type:complete len:365 (+) Transcript_153742:1085-2179(+)